MSLFRRRVQGSRIQGASAGARTPRMFIGVSFGDLEGPERRSTPITVARDVGVRRGARGACPSQGEEAFQVQGPRSSPRQYPTERSP